MGTDRRQRLLLIAAIACVALLLGTQFVVRPLAAVWHSWSDRIDVAQKNLTMWGPQVTRVPELRTRWGEYKKRSLPREQQTAEGQLLGAVSRWAGANRLNVTTVKPSWRLSDEKDAKSRTVQVQVTATGNLSSVAGFLYSLETDPMPLRVEDVELTTRDPKGDQLTLRLTFTGLVVLEEKS